MWLKLSWVGVKNFGFTEKQKNIEQGSRGYPGPGGVLPLISPLILLQLCIDFTRSSVSLSWRNSMFQRLELLKEKKRKFLGGSGGMLPRKILKVETKICAIWGILEANLKKSSTPMFMMNISFVPSICIHRSIIFIFIEKISTYFLTIVTNLKFSLSPTVCVCVCVCVLRERERKKEREITVSFPRPAYPKIHLSVLQTVCVRIFRFMIGLFSLFCLVLCLFVLFRGFFFGCPTNQSRQNKVSRTIFLP